MKFTSKFKGLFTFKNSGKKSKKRKKDRLGSFSSLFNDFANMNIESLYRPVNIRESRKKARKLVNNQGFCKRFVNIGINSTIGKRGIMISSRMKNSNGDFLKENSELEELFNNWAIDGADCTKRNSFKGLQKLIFETFLVDGEVFIRKLRGFDNEYGFSLQVIDCDHIPLDLNENLDNGNIIKNGIEFDQFNAPVAYYVVREYPDMNHFVCSSSECERILADDMIHIPLLFRSSQVRGVTAFQPILNSVDELHQYYIEEMKAARVASLKMGFLYKSEDAEDIEDVGYSGEDGEDTEENKEENAVRTIVSNNPHMEVMPEKWKAEALNWDRPSTSFGPFAKVYQRLISSGLNCTYNTLANDLEGVNFSSINWGKHEERLGWENMQEYIGEKLILESYKEVIYASYLRNKIKKLSFSDLKKAVRNAVCLYPSFKGVDPVKTATANKINLQCGRMTFKEMCEEDGVDYEERLKQIEKERPVWEQFFGSKNKTGK